MDGTCVPKLAEQTGFIFSALNIGKIPKHNELIYKVIMDSVKNYLHQEIKTNKAMTEKHRGERSNYSLHQSMKLVLRGTYKVDNTKLVRYIEALQYTQSTEGRLKTKLAVSAKVMRLQ